MERKLCENITSDEERAFYGLEGADILNCRFEGKADGESALKECSDITVCNCDFDLRYPLWHVSGFELESCRMSENVRAGLWYSCDGKIKNVKSDGIKALRECDRVKVVDSDFKSDEFGWRCRDIEIDGGSLISVYPFFECRNLKIGNFMMKGKYSFQYVENAEIADSYLDTKDAFWHCRNVTVRNCTVKGEYLGWYSENLTLINCRIVGTQPLCYCKNLRLENCTMEGTDLSFEYSDVNAEIIGQVMSVKNPKSGKITADSFGEIILENSKFENECEIITR